MPKHRFTRTFPMRAVEWLMACVTITLGVVMFQPATDWNHTEVAGLVEMAAPATWGAVCVALGVTRFAALVINGAWRPSPHIRATMAFFTCFIWTQIAITILSSGVVTLAWGVIPWFVIAELYSVLRASCDARLSDDRAKIIGGATYHVRS